MSHLSPASHASLSPALFRLGAGVWGGKGQGKSFQVELIFKALGVEPVILSAGEMESEWAGDMPPPIALVPESSCAHRLHHVCVLRGFRRAGEVDPGKISRGLPSGEEQGEDALCLNTVRLAAQATPPSRLTPYLHDCGRV